MLGSGAAPTINRKVSFLEIQMFLEVLARNQEYDKGRITVVSYFNESVILNIFNVLTVYILFLVKEL